MSAVYLDHAATTRPLPEAERAMRPFISRHYGNPMSGHDLGSEARAAVEEARGRVASLIGAKDSEIVFVSCGSEANNLAIKGAAFANAGGNGPKGKGHIITTAIEHPSVLEPIRFLERQGFPVTMLPVDRNGRLNPESVRKAVRRDTILVSLALANHEIGTVQPIGEIARILRAENKEVLLHVDATFSAGLIPCDVKDLDCDLLSMSAHRFYGPKGAGALYVRSGVKLEPLVHGGAQEGGMRAGMPDVPAIVGMGVAAEIAAKRMKARMSAALKLKKMLRSGLEKSIKHIVFNGDPDNSMPNVLNACMKYVEGESMIMLLSDKKIYTASSSACTSRKLKASHVLLGIGLDHSTAQGSLIFSFGEENTKKDVEHVLKALPKIVSGLREMSPMYPGD